MPPSHHHHHQTPTTGPPPSSLVAMAADSPGTPGSMPPFNRPDFMKVSFVDLSLIKGNVLGLHSYGFLDVY
jgi:hypothetical protein